jgi:DNA (cytosine-5)-methyltransferase 1
MTCVDLFAGAGGFSTGAVMAGYKVLCAANHWQAAVETHQRNHPNTKHILQDLCIADFTTFPRHDVLLASPACQGHSRARGRERQHHDSCRSTAWAIIPCLEIHQPAFVLVENVPEFLKWKLYPAWRFAIEALGYAITENVLDSADYGVPQHRRRVFVLAVKGRVPLGLRPPARQHCSARSVIRWNEGQWRPEQSRRRSARTLHRINVGRRDQGERFLLAYYGNERGGRSVDQPLGTVTTRDRFAAVDGDLMRMLRIDEYKAAMGFAAAYWLPDQHRTALHLLGNAVCPPVAANILNNLHRNI